MARKNKKRQKTAAATNEDGAKPNRNVSTLPRLLRPTTLSLSIGGTTIPGDTVTCIESYCDPTSRNSLAMASALPLSEDEYLLKIRKGDDDADAPTGFMTKLTKKSLLPKAFASWDDYDEAGPIYIFKETYKSGWKLNGWRIGVSRSWAEMRHPLGFTVEIHLDSLLPIILENDLKKGTLEGKWKWTYGNLLKE